MASRPLTDTKKIKGVLMMRCLVAAAVCFAFIAGSAMADTAPDMGGHAMAAEPGEMDEGMMGGGMMGGGRGPGHVCHIVGSGHHMAGTLAFLKTELKITAAQSSAWERFADAFSSMGPSRGAAMMHGKGGMGGRKGMEKQSALPERMDRHERMMEERLGGMKKMHGVIRELYGKLGDEQKRMADELIPAFMMCRMRG